MFPETIRKTCAEEPTLDLRRNETEGTDAGRANQKPAFQGHIISRG